MTRPRTRPAAPGIFVTGTDTGVGKTVVARGLLRLAADRALELRPFKPAESGCHNGVPADALALLSASRHPRLPISLVCPFRYRAPVAPAAAARTPLTPRDLIRAATALATFATRAPVPLLVETAGGLLSPYAADLTAADLASHLALPIVLIARNGLGTINHTALAIAELRRRGLPLIGVILVTTTPARDLARQRNAALIEALTGVRPLALVPHLARPDTDAATDRVAALLARSGAGDRIFAAGQLRAPAPTGRRARRFPFSGR